MNFINVVTGQFMIVRFCLLRTDFFKAVNRKIEKGRLLPLTSGEEASIRPTFFKTFCKLCFFPC